MRIEKSFKDDEYLLRKQKIKGYNLYPRETYAAALSREPNRRILGFSPYLRAYYSGLQRYDTAKIRQKIRQTDLEFSQRKSEAKDSVRIRKLENKRIKKIDHLELQLNEGNYLMRVVGEPPVFHNLPSAEKDRANLLSRCYQKGLFGAQVTLKIDTAKKSKRVDVTYQITEGIPTRINTINFSSQQSEMDSLLRANAGMLKLKSGGIYDEEKLQQDRDILERILKNKGYFKFRRQFIFIDLDTFSTAPHKMDVYYRIVRPDIDSAHFPFTIKSVYFTTDYRDDITPKRSKKYVDGVYYLFEKERYSKKVLNSKVDLRGNTLYSLKNMQSTQRNLNNLDAFRIVNIFYNDTGAYGLNAFINTSPLDRFEISEEAGLGVSQGLPGPFGNLGFKARNLLGGFEVLDMNIRGSIEGQAAFTSDQQNYSNYSTELNASATLTFPQLVLPGKFRLKFRNLNPKTRLQLAYNYNFRPEYERYNLKLAYIYSIQPSEKSLINFSVADFTLVNTNKSQSFEDFLQDLRRRGNPLIFAFNQSIISSIKLEYVYNSHDPTEFKKGFYFRTFLESGGTLLNLLSNQQLATDRLLGLELYRFYKLSADLRKYIPVTRSSLLATRLAAGYASPYGSGTVNEDGTVSNPVLPYEKFFFTGGSASNRAWRPRRLGPGSFTPERFPDGTINYALEQPGEILFEGNAELRVKVVRMLGLGLFIDASNVWNIREDATREGAQFKPTTFIDQIALGAGIGIRLDFSFLILRVDVGAKIKDPAQEFRSTWMFDKFSLRQPFGERGQTNINIGIGYPF